MTIPVLPFPFLGLGALPALPALPGNGSGGKH
jgi:hypothetical protein